MWRSGPPGLQRCEPVLPVFSCDARAEKGPFYIWREFGDRLDLVIAPLHVLRIDEPQPGDICDACPQWSRQATGLRCTLQLVFEQDAKFHTCRIELICWRAKQVFCALSPVLTRLASRSVHKPEY